MIKNLKKIFRSKNFENASAVKAKLVQKSKRKMKNKEKIEEIELQEIKREEKESLVPIKEDGEFISSFTSRESWCTFPPEP